jgi:hypothetical protein
MKHTFYKRLCVAQSVVLVSALCVFLMYTQVSATAGTELDPVVTRSYVHSELSLLQIEIQRLQTENAILRIRADNLEAALIATDGTVTGVYRIVEMQPGEALFARANTHIIVRTGRATAIMHENGLINMTAGLNVPHGQEILHNNLYISANDDGRGMNFSTHAWVMVMGEYYVVRP